MKLESELGLSLGAGTVVGAWSDRLLAFCPRDWRLRIFAGLKASSADASQAAYDHCTVPKHPLLSPR